jgi:hypothetical protein
MRISAQNRIKEAAGGRGTRWAQPPRAISSITLPVFSSRRAHPDSLVSSVRITGAPPAGLPCCPLTARSRERKKFARESFREPLLKQRTTR